MIRLRPAARSPTATKQPKPARTLPEDPALAPSALIRTRSAAPRPAPTRRGVLSAALAAGGLGTLALAGCGLAERPYAEKRAWPLSVTRPDPVPAPPGGKVLLLRSLRAAAWLSSRGLQVLQPDGSVRTDFYEEWSVPPAQGVEDSLRLWLAASGVFAAVVSPGSRSTADYVLEAELTALLADPPAAQARAAIAAVLIDQRRGGSRIALQRSFAASPKLVGAAPAAMVQAQREALAETFGQIERALAVAV